jgi:hypothetical protein
MAALDRAVDGARAYLMAALGLLGACGGKVTGTGDAGAGLSTAMGDAGAGFCTQYRCLDPSPILMGRFDTGFDLCADGAERRRAGVECPSTIPRSTSQCPGGAVPPECATDQDCTARPNGFCDSCTCAYGCRTDSECSPGHVCQCSDPVGLCVPAACSTAQSCLPGCDCVSPSAVSGFTCQTPADECLSSSDCPSAGCGSLCAPSDPDSSGFLTCSSIACAGALTDSLAIGDATTCAAPR